MTTAQIAVDDWPAAAPVMDRKCLRTLTLPGPAIPNLTIESCEFTDCDFLNKVGRGWLFHRCKFTRCTVRSNLMHCIFSDCDFEGIFTGNQLATNGDFLYADFDDAVRTIGADSTAFIGCRFKGTSRGPIFQNAGPWSQGCKNLLLACLDFDGIRRVPNGNEFGAEGPDKAFENILISQIRMSGGTGPILSLWDTPCNNIRVVDMQSLTPADIIISGICPQTNISLENIELLGGHILVNTNGTLASNCTIKDSTFSGFVPGRRNQEWVNPSAFTATAVISDLNSGGNTKVINCKFNSLPAGIAPMAGVIAS